ncbi:hypothetical protein BGZ61DRAFT_16648 [Ilyonectria robusta]|uniref:uncharacterized protein n=1 Tax=Ilyonectria robusta TaxID=1079257 RepID=UPI001E8E75FD|nr:uncharacterized protein BGZ61DRAFT_16648 [Ilyonectria robusta]KAH8737482.1 hypothetical protein BGZ61DRAFT_16648 [Ilyonectria robusta]
MARFSALANGFGKHGPSRPHMIKDQCDLIVLWWMVDSQLQCGQLLECPVMDRGAMSGRFPIQPRHKNKLPHAPAQNKPHGWGRGWAGDRRERERGTHSMDSVGCLWFATNFNRSHFNPQYSTTTQLSAPLGLSDMSWQSLDRCIIFFAATTGASRVPGHQSPQ